MFKFELFTSIVGNSPSKTLKVYYDHYNLYTVASETLLVCSHSWLTITLKKITPSGTHGHKNSIYKPIHSDLLSLGTNPQ